MNSSESMRAVIGAFAGLLVGAVAVTVETTTSVDTTLIATWSGVALAGYRVAEAVIDWRLRLRRGG